MSSFKNFEAPTSFLDLLFNVMLLFGVLFVVSFLLINPVKKDETMEAKAEFIITVEWDNESHDDVDTYVRDPQNRVVFYQAREMGLLHLDRDDLGSRNDTVLRPDGTKVEVKQNREIVSVRGIIPGEYIATVHMYSMQGAAGGVQRDRDVEVTIKLDKINPQFKTVTERKVTLRNTGDEKTAFRFTVGRNGEIIDVNELDYKIATNPRNNEIFNQNGDG